MALMFQRLARNFAKNGYFPTDSETTIRILNALCVADGDGPVRLLDPCCGEGVAIAECKYHLGHRAEVFGVEYNSERAYHAKKILDHVIHGDISDTMIGAGQYGLLLLNPPYGDGVSDHVNGGCRTRLEEEFYRRTVPLLQLGGVLVLIIPYYSLNKAMSTMISRHFDRVQVFMAPEQQFKQVVIFGIKKRASSPIKSVKETLMAVGDKSNPVDELPVHWTDLLYIVPESTAPYKFSLVRLDRAQLEHEMSRLTGLNRQFNAIFGNRTLSQRRPLRALSKWHTGLSLAAGQVSGIVVSNDGTRTFVIKGDTYKGRKAVSTVDTDADGNPTEVRTVTDYFVPVLRGIDFTPGPDYGRVLTIK